MLIYMCVYKWQGLKCKVPPDFCQETKLCTRQGILRMVQQLGAPANFKTLAARTRPHGGLRRARLAPGGGLERRRRRTGRGARAGTGPFACG